MPNELSLRGHTDSIPYGPNATYTNWELSSDRANATRRVLLETGMPKKRINNVMGKSDTEHLFPKEPNSPQNRRITIILLREELTNPEAFKKKAKALGATLRPRESSNDKLDLPPLPKIGTFKKTPGVIEFP